ncbi:hypothetical protein CLU88_1833 [Acidovorax sp. 56]|nr:hypothetical protein CLU88_1833 [Acidovorax sp. 56]
MIGCPSEIESFDGIGCELGKMLKPCEMRILFIPISEENCIRHRSLLREGCTYSFDDSECSEITVVWGHEA